MARCGTSVTAGILQNLGIDMGKKEEPNTNNPKGSLEDSDFAKLNEEFFSLAKEDQTGLPQHNQIIQLKEKFGKKIENLITRKSQGSSLWGWKSPASSLTIELFLPYLKNPHFVIVFRNPLHAAKSITAPTSKAHDMPLEQAIQTISTFNKELINFISRHPTLPKIYVTFEDIIKNQYQRPSEYQNFLILTN